MTARLSFARVMLFSLVFALIAISQTLAQVPTEDEAETIPPIGTGALDSRIYIGTSGIKGDPTANSEEKIVFQRGRFKSFAFNEAAGFDVGNYTTEQKGKNYTFHAEVERAAVGKMVWDGIVTPDSLHGTAVWYRPGMDSVLVWTTCWIQKPFDPLHKPLDGKTIVGKIGNQGDSSGTEEVLTFTSGQFHSQSSDTYGFHPSLYQINPRYDTLYFLATTPGPKHTDRTWRGWFYKGRMEAEIDWNSEDSTKPRYLWFKGKESKQTGKK